MEVSELTRRFINGNPYLGEGVPYEPEPELPEDLDDDDAVEAYIERNRAEYRASFGTYLREFRERPAFVDLSGQFSLMR